MQILGDVCDISHRLSSHIWLEVAFITVKVYWIFGHHYFQLGEKLSSCLEKVCAHGRGGRGGGGAVRSICSVAIIHISKQEHLSALYGSEDVGSAVVASCTHQNACSLLHS